MSVSGKDYCLTVWVCFRCNWVLGESMRKKSRVCFESFQRMFRQFWMCLSLFLWNLHTIPLSTAIGLVSKYQGRIPRPFVFFHNQDMFSRFHLTAAFACNCMCRHCRIFCLVAASCTPRRSRILHSLGLSDAHHRCHRIVCHLRLLSGNADSQHILLWLSTWPMRHS